VRGGRARERPKSGNVAAELVSFRPIRHIDEAASGGAVFETLGSDE
jgi:hypothetical protein